MKLQRRNFLLRRWPHQLLPPALCSLEETLPVSARMKNLGGALVIDLTSYQGSYSVEDVRPQSLPFSVDLDQTPMGAYT